MSRPVIVFEGRNEFDAQMARDILQSALIPVLHIPSLSTGIFGTSQATRVAVPEEYVEAAVEALREEGLEPVVQEPSKGLEAVRDDLARNFPRGTPGKLPEGSRLRWVLILLVVGIVLAVAYAVTRARP